MKNILERAAEAAGVDLEIKENPKYACSIHGTNPVDIHETLPPYRHYCMDCIFDFLEKSGITPMSKIEEEKKREFKC